MRYEHFIIKKFSKTIIQNGKKHKALNLFFKTLGHLKIQGDLSALEQLIKSVESARPTLYYRKIKQGSKITYLPKLLTMENQLKQAINWLVVFSRKKKKNFLLNLKKEIALSLEGQGDAVEEKKKTYYLLTDSRPFLYLIKYYKI